MRIQCCFSLPYLAKQEEFLTIERDASIVVNQQDTFVVHDFLLEDCEFLWIGVWSLWRQSL